MSETELANLIARHAGIPVTDADLAPGTVLADLGVDSLGMLGVVAAIERSHRVRLPADTEHTATVGEFLAAVNTCLAEGQ